MVGGGGTHSELDGINESEYSLSREVELVREKMTFMILCNSSESDTKNMLICPIVKDVKKKEKSSRVKFTLKTNYWKYELRT